MERNLDDLPQNNPFLVVVIGDFNVKSNNWYSRDKSSLEDDTVDNKTKQYGLYQVIRETTHILDNTSSCIDLIFTYQPNLITESGVHPSLHPNCHHQIIYAKFNLQIYFPPPYLREVFHYKGTNTDLIKRAITKFNRQRAILNTTVDEKVGIFTVLNTAFNRYRNNSYNLKLKRHLKFFRENLNILTDFFSRKFRKDYSESRSQ